jgi:hypothetical protein
MFKEMSRLILESSFKMKGLILDTESCGAIDRIDMTVGVLV